MASTTGSAHPWRGRPASTFVAAIVVPIRREWSRRIPNGRGASWVAPPSGSLGGLIVGQIALEFETFNGSREVGNVLCEKMSKNEWKEWMKPMAIVKLSETQIMTPYLGQRVEKIWAIPKQWGNPSHWIVGAGSGDTGQREINRELQIYMDYNT